ncbi:putative transcriptional regulator [Constrictibacter sp. MBR-5]|jgi:predicted transcriptional regulator|uniref:CBS domain-containing protein n=1 Tax=Constrictibacter sp. MBR-5 TaxID=3156467 RepID=UPI003392EFCE
MTADVKTCAPFDAVEDIWTQMKQTGFMHLPVIDTTRRPLGVLATRGVLEPLLDEREHEETPLINYVKGIGYR